MRQFRYTDADFVHSLNPFMYVYLFVLSWKICSVFDNLCGLKSFTLNVIVTLCYLIAAGGISSPYLNFNPAFVASVSVLL